MYTEEAMQVLYSCYRKIIKVDLQNDSYILVKEDESEKLNADFEKMKFSEYLQWYTGKDLIHEYDRDEFLAKTDIHYIRDFFETGNKCLVIHYRKKEQEYNWFSMNIVCVDNYSEENMVAFVYIKVIKNNYTANTEYMRELQYINSHDTLTGLMNFYAYRGMLVDYNPSVKKKNVTAIFADINGLKYVNDTMGHTEGNKLICRFAQMLMDVFLKEYIFRISGDEFVVTLYDLEDELVNEFYSKLKALIDADDIPIASVGIWSERKVTNIENVVSKAEEKMYEEKEIFHKNYPDYSR